MALKDLISDLSNFKYGMTSPDQVDNQIETGVDFFPNDDASGFTPKTNLESLYNQVQNGTFGKTWPEAARENTKTRQAYGRAAEYLEVGGVGLSNPSYLLDTDTFGTPWSDVKPKHPPRFQSPFMATPIAGAVSMFNEDPFTLTHGVKPGSNSPTGINGDKTYNDRSYSIYSQPGGNSFSSPSNPNAHRIGDEWGYNLPAPNSTAGQGVLELPRLIINDKRRGVFDHVINTLFEHQPFPINQAPNSVFSPIYDRYFNEASTITSVTMVSQPDPISGVMDEFPSYETSIGARSIHISPDGELKAGLRYASGAGGSWEFYNNGTEIVDVISTGTVTPLDLYAIDNIGQLSTTSQKRIVPISAKIGLARLLTPSEIQQIDDLTGDLYDTQANMDSQDFYSQATSNNNAATDIAQQIAEIEERQVDSPTWFGGSTMYHIRSISSAEQVGNKGGDNSDYLTKKNLGSFTFGKEFGPTTLGSLAGIEVKSGKEFLGIKLRDRKFKIDNAILRYGGDPDAWLGIEGTNDFPKTPAGLNENNKLSFKPFREVADPGRNNHPLILRDIGNLWGVDSIDTGFIGETLGGFVPGAPGLTGYVSRTLMDKFRIGKWVLGTADGLGFLGKQFILQGLNPTLETKIFNPLSILGLVGASEAWEVVKTAIGDIRGVAGQTINIGEFAEGFAQFAASALFQIGHTERHFGNGAYHRGDDESVVVNEATPDGRVAQQAYAFSAANAVPEVPPLTTPFGFLNDYVNNMTNEMAEMATAGQYAIKFGKSNPNKYLFYISSSPKSVKKGKPSFLGSGDLVLTDINEAITKPGGTFNPASHKRDEEKTPDIQTHFTLPYSRLNMENSYEGGVDEDAKLTSMITKLAGKDKTSNYLEKIRNEYLKVSKKIGGTTKSAAVRGGTDNALETLGVIKGDVKDTNVDRVNILPVLHGETKPSILNSTGENTSPYKDFIKFMFRDVVNNKWLVFRSILSGVTDTATPDFNEHKYIGRPDKLYTYSGVTREIGFNMKTYPKTKQELPMLMEKMNYLVGLCYPSFTETERMVAPFIELTIGDMFVGTPGLLGSVAVTVEDATTWEIENGLQFPHYISTAITFKHIGKHLPVTMGKHYDLPWISGDKVAGTVPVGSWTTPASDYPDRAEKFKAYDTLAASDAASQAEGQGAP